MVMKVDLMLGGGHTMQYTDNVLQNCTLDTYFIHQCHPNTFNLKNLKTIISCYRPILSF